MHISVYITPLNCYIRYQYMYIGYNNLGIVKECDAKSVKALETNMKKYSGSTVYFTQYNSGVVSDIQLIAKLCMSMISRL